MSSLKIVGGTYLIMSAGGLCTCLHTYSLAGYRYTVAINDGFRNAVEGCILDIEFYCLIKEHVDKSIDNYGSTYNAGLFWTLLPAKEFSLFGRSKTFSTP